MLSYKTILSAVLAAGGVGLIGGCSSYDGDYGHHDRYGYGYDHHDYDRHDYRDAGYAGYRQEQLDRNKEIGDHNTRVSDKLDDGRVNGSARSYEERKASRAADEGVPGARREERELRNERLDGR